MRDESRTLPTAGPRAEAVDAVVAAAGHHRVLLENDHVRVLDTRIAPGERTPVHTHGSPAVLHVLGWSDFVRRDADGNVLVDSRTLTAPPVAGATLWSPALGPHSAENVGDRELHVLAVELKGGGSVAGAESRSADSALPASPLAAWHAVVRNRDVAGLDALLADEVVFHSPVVRTPQRGKALALQYLQAALQVFGNPSFRYVRELAGERDAVLEFEVQIDGLDVNGVDLLRWNEAGRIVDFKVLLRPLKAVLGIQQKMAALLEQRS